MIHLLSSNQGHADCKTYQGRFTDCTSLLQMHDIILFFYTERRHFHCSPGETWAMQSTHLSSWNAKLHESRDCITMQTRHQHSWNILTSLNSESEESSITLYHLTKKPAQKPTDSINTAFSHLIRDKKCKVPNLNCRILQSRLCKVLAEQ